LMRQQLLFCLVVCCFLFSSVSAEDQIHGKWFDRIMIIIFENTGYSTAMADPNFYNIAQKGLTHTTSYAIVHPSQPNYICQIGGALLYRENFDVNLTETSLVNLMEDKGISWKAYAEAYPGNCFGGYASKPYVRRHNPFISFDYVRENPAICAKIVNSNELDVDLDSGHLPQYNYFIPDLNSDGHDTNITYAGKWLKNFLDERLPKLPPGTLVVVTFDEDYGEDFNRIYTVLLGDMVTPGSTDSTRYDHFSLLRTVEDNWDLGTLGRNDSTAIPYTLPLLGQLLASTDKTSVPIDISKAPRKPALVPVIVISIAFTVVGILLGVVLFFYRPIKNSITNLLPEHTQEKNERTPVLDSSSRR